MTEKRGSWYLLTGALIGLIAGMILSAWILPVRYVNADPASLRQKDRQAYRALIAQAYLAEGDVYRALARLRLLQDANPSEEIISQAQNMLAEGGSEAQARALALLAAAVNEPSISVTPLSPLNPIVVQTTGTSEINPLVTGSATELSVTRTPGPTLTPRPTITPMATAGPPFVKQGEAQTICDPLPAKPLLQIVVLNAAGQPVLGVKIEISQSGGGIETFFTGLFPENRGYADYEMLPGLSYAIRVGEAGQLVSDLSAPTCEGGSFGNLKLTFKQP